MDEVDYATVPFAKCLASSEDSSANQSRDGIDVLVTAKDEGRDMASITSKKGDIGRILALQTSSSMPVLPDPLPVMDVLSKGQWVVIDTSGWMKIDEGERLSMALPLIELFSSAAPRDTRTGGIGFTCRTKNEVVRTAMFIQSMTNGGNSEGRNVRTKTLSSGIVVPDDDAVVGFVSGFAAPRFAIICPYDMELLRTATLLLGDEQ